jgi:hypothetical protein
MRASLVQTRSDVQLMAALTSLQLDNQMLEATKPVVLSPADMSSSGR